VLSVTAGGEPGDLSLLRTLEALAIGVQGKRCLWRALQNLRPVLSTVDGMTFIELEARADDRESCEMMLEALRGYGASVRCAMSATEAVGTLPEFKPDLVMSDIAMAECTPPGENSGENKARGVPRRGQHRGRGLARPDGHRGRPHLEIHR
jgi:hypothetical protein